MFSICYDVLGRISPQLAAFVLDKEAHGFADPHIRLHAYFSPTKHVRQAGPVLLKTSDRTFTFSEMSTFPVGFLMTIASDPPDARVTDISDFATYRYDQDATIKLQMPLLDASSPYPGHFHAIERVDPSRIPLKIVSRRRPVRTSHREFPRN